LSEENLGGATSTLAGGKCIRNDPICETCNKHGGNKKYTQNSDCKISGNDAKLNGRAIILRALNNQSVRAWTELSWSRK